MLFPKSVARLLNKDRAGQRRAEANRLEADARALRRVTADAYRLDADARLLRREADEIDRKSRAANRSPWES